MNYLPKLGEWFDSYICAAFGIQNYFQDANTLTAFGLAAAVGVAGAGTEASPKPKVARLLRNVSAGVAANSLLLGYRYSSENSNAAYAAVGVGLAAVVATAAGEVWRQRSRLEETVK